MTGLNASSRVAAGWTVFAGSIDRVRIGGARLRVTLLAVAVAGLFPAGAEAQAPVTASIRITSPLGRTGVVTRVRIVAQVDVPPGQVFSPVSFYVDGKLVGTADAGHYSAVDWVDENPSTTRPDGLYPTCSHPHSRFAKTAWSKRSTWSRARS
jgi:hypothetical protein